MSLINELRRRRVFRIAAFYIVGAWAILQVADLAFPGMQIPELAIRYVWIWAFACFPIALVIGWRYDMVGGHIVRTPALAEEHHAHLNRADYGVFTILTAVVVVISLTLAAKILEQLQKMPRRGGRGYGIADVEIYARQGKTRLALDTLRQVIDQGWRGVLWAQGESSPHMVSILEEPEFKAMMEDVRADMATQLARVRKMEANGELATVPELTAH